MSGRAEESRVEKKGGGKGRKGEERGSQRMNGLRRIRDTIQKKKRTRSGDTQGALNLPQLLLGHKTRMSNIPDIDRPALLPSQLPNHILGSETISHGSDPLDALSLDILDDFFDDRRDSLDGMSLEPFLNIKGARSVQLENVAVEEVGHVSLVAVGSELVSDELGIEEGVADDVGQEKDGGGRVRGSGGGRQGDICFGCWRRKEQAVQR